MADRQDDVWIRAEGLSKYYGAFTAIEDVSFTVSRGSITAFLGPNGAGKSTTLRCLTGYLSPSKGRAEILGYDMGTHRIAGSKSIGYLGESGALYPDMTPVSYLRFMAQSRGMNSADITRNLDRVADLCRLGEVWSKPIRKLSRGFRQRVGLAQALIHDPKVLILDEPTLGLDPNQISMVRDLIRSIAKEKAVLLSTHILQEVAAMADRVLLIDEGRLKYDGRLDGLTEGSSLEHKFRELTGGQAA